MREIRQTGAFKRDRKREAIRSIRRGADLQQAGCWQLAVAPPWLTCRAKTV